MRNLITCLTVCILSGATFADPWIVSATEPGADFDNIQDAVDAASDGDSIGVMPGIYTGSDTSYPLSVVEVSNKSLTIFKFPPGDSEPAIIDGGGTHIGIICSGSKSTLVIHGFTIQNCGEANHPGGGLFCSDINPRIEKCTFIRNHSGTVGGGIYVGPNSSPIIEDCQIINNYASESGGGIYVESNSMTLISTTVCANEQGQITGKYTDGGENLICEYTNSWTVDDDGKADFDNIQDALDAAGEGDEIVVMPGTYTSISEYGVAYITNRFVTIRSSDPTDPEVVASTIIDGQDIRRGVSCYGWLGINNIDRSSDVHKNIFKHRTTSSERDSPGQNSSRAGWAFESNFIRIEGFSFANGYAEDGLNDYEGYTGGGILTVDTNISVANCTFVGNSGYMGGAIALWMSDTNYSTITDCKIINNETYDGYEIHGSSYDWGGGIWAYHGNTSVINCLIDGNTCFYAGPAIGAFETTLLLKNCTIQNNAVLGNNPNGTWGGGVDASGCNNGTIIEECAFIGNSGVIGGGLHISPQNNVVADIQVNNCIFENNMIDGTRSSSDFEGGAGLRVRSFSSLQQYSIYGCEFVGNTALFGWGGGARVGSTSGSSDTIFMSGCSFRGNTAPVGGGLFCDGNSNDLVIDTSLFCSNIPENIFGDFIDGGDNLFYEACIGDCNWNGIPDEEDIANGTSYDCDQNGVPDECQPDCDGDGFIDPCDNEGDCDGDGLPDNCELDCNENAIPDDCDIAYGISEDCNENGIPDECDIDEGTSVDVNGNGIPDECEVDCNSNNIPDIWDIKTGYSEDCNVNGVPDDCDIDNGSSDDLDEDGIPDECEDDCNSNNIPDHWDIKTGNSEDCNTNGIPDECDTDGGASNDVNGNGIPDECEIDCNENAIPDSWDIYTGYSADCNINGIPDECDIDSGASNDVNGNEVPDECEADCNNNGAPDEWEIKNGWVEDCNLNSIPDSCDVIDGTSNDINGNSIPDECEDDCNVNGLPDSYEIALGLAEDCNENSIPDECDINSGLSNDTNENDIPDECEADCNNNGYPDSYDIDMGWSDDLNTDGVPDECQCLADITEDGVVNVNDLLAVIGYWGSSIPAGDLNYDGVVNVNDLLVVIANWGPCE